MVDGTLHLVGFANPVDFLPAFLHPVFAFAPQSNVQYSQRVDEGGRIAGFEEVEVTGDLIAAQQMHEATIGDAALYAFGTGALDPVLFGPRVELAALLAERRNAYKVMPALYLAIVEFCDLDEVKSANLRAYQYLSKRAGAAVARSWRDSQIVLPIIRGLLADAADQPGADDARSRRVSVYSTTPSRLRVQAEGYDPSIVSNILHSRKARQALASTGLADKVSVALIASVAAESGSSASLKQVRTPSRDRGQLDERSSLELALEELVERGMSGGLRRWLDDLIRKDFQNKSNDFPYYVSEWCDRQAVSRAAVAYARLLTLDAVPIALFRDITHWLALRASDEDVGPVFPPAIALLRARDTMHLAQSRGVARGAIISVKQESRRAAKAVVEEELRESEIPLWGLRWVEENRRSFLAPQVLQALIELPFDLPPVLKLTRDWLRRDGRRPDAGRLLIALLRSNDRLIDLEILVHDVARWISENHDHADAPQLLNAMLTRTQPIKGTEPFDIAAHWVQLLKPRGDVLTVLSKLLGIAPNDKKLTRVALKIANSSDDLRTASRSLSILLNNPKVPDDVRWRAEQWLEEHPHDPVALAVFEAYFRHDSLVRRKPVYARRALALVHQYPKRAAVAPLLTNLLARFPGDDTILDSALDWLTSNNDSGARGRPVVLELLQLKSRKRRGPITSAARRWLASHPTDSKVGRALDVF